jgi:hypothetical protein
MEATGPRLKFLKPDVELRQRKLDYCFAIPNPETLTKRWFVKSVFDPSLVDPTYEKWPCDIEKRAG